MPEPTVADVELFTGGRLLASDVETHRALQRALATIRKYVGWHVLPQRIDDVVTLDGPGSPLLALPTLNLVTLTSVVEDEVTLDTDDLTSSVTGRLLVKKSGMNWSDKLQSITVTMTHGFDSAPDFEQAVLEFIDTTTLKVGIGAVGALQRHRVDDEEREWRATGDGSRFETGGLNATLLEQYRLIPAI